MEKFDPEVRALMKAAGLSEAYINNQEVKLTMHVRNRDKIMEKAVEVTPHLQDKFDSSPLVPMED